MSAHVDDASLVPAPPVDPRDIDAIGATLTQLDARHTLKMPDPAPGSSPSETAPTDAYGKERGVQRQRPVKLDLHLVSLDGEGQGYVPVAAYYPFRNPGMSDLGSPLDRFVVNGYTLPCPGRVVDLKTLDWNFGRPLIMYDVLFSENESAQEASCKRVAVIILSSTMEHWPGRTRSYITLYDAWKTFLAIGNGEDRPVLHINRSDPVFEEVDGRVLDTYMARDSRSDTARGCGVTLEGMDAYVFIEAQSPESPPHDGVDASPTPFISFGRYKWTQVAAKAHDLDYFEPQPMLKDPNLVQQSRNKYLDPPHQGELAYAQYNLPLACKTKENAFDDVFLEENEIAVFKKAATSMYAHTQKLARDAREEAAKQAK